MVIAAFDLNSIASLQNAHAQHGSKKELKGKYW